jgi:hypothetical protein
VFFVVWTFLALMRESRAALDFLIPRLEHAWRWMVERADKSQRAWKIAGLLCAAVIVAITLYRAWPIWHFKATSSLREDEIISIVKYTSRGFVPAISTYSRSRSAGQWSDFPVRHAELRGLSPSGCAPAERFGSTFWRSCVFWEPIPSLFMLCSRVASCFWRSSIVRHGRPSWRA